MRIKCVEIVNFRKLKSTHVDLDPKTTIFVGANNSGKTSAMVALRYFLVSPKGLALRDITISNWKQIDVIGTSWETGGAVASNCLDSLLPSLDVWLEVPLSEIQHVVHILPTLDWKGGDLGVRLRYRVVEMDLLKADYLLQRKAAILAAKQTTGPDGAALEIWPASLTDYLGRKLHSHIELDAFALDPTAKVHPLKGIATPQSLPEHALPLGKHPFRSLLKIDEITAQRDFADAGERGAGEGGTEASSRRFKRRLSEQLRTYYDRHLDPTKTPSEKDYEALRSIQTAERSFDSRLEEGFASAFEELEGIGYPGIANPRLKITTQLRAIDGLKHGSALQYEVTGATDEGVKALKLPEDYSGLGYQNLIAMVFMLMGFRDDWMRVGKARAEADSAQEKIPPLHLVLVEEPEAHLHAQVQQVFIKNAYHLLRKHPDLGEALTFRTQLVVSTHSSHVAHEADFANLRYFRRRPAPTSQETATTTVASLSHVFGDEDETQRFVKRYLKATHCDVFFADGIIFVEGQAERILVPHFIRHHFSTLPRRYTTLIELGGSHAHKFAPLVDELGVTTLVIADLDAVVATKIKNKNGVEQTVWKAARPECGKGQNTSNSVLKAWHPRKLLVDELAALKDEEHRCPDCEGYALYVTYQKPVPVSGGDGDMVIPRTFEDALIFENLAVVEGIKGSATSEKIRAIVQRDLTGEELACELFDLLKEAEKAAFALDCLMLEDPKALKPPAYIRAGLTWFEKALSVELAEAAAQENQS